MSREQQIRCTAQKSSSHVAPLHEGCGRKKQKNNIVPAHGPPLPSQGPQDISVWVQPLPVQGAPPDRSVRCLRSLSVTEMEDASILSWKEKRAHSGTEESFTNWKMCWQSLQGGGVGGGSMQSWTKCILLIFFGTLSQRASKHKKAS